MRRILTIAAPFPAFIAAYVSLDWVSYIHAFRGLNITPWNPALALALVCSLKFGRALFVPWLFAMLIGDLTIRALPIEFWKTALLDVCLLAGYVSIAERLRRQASVRELLAGRRNLLAWIVISGVGTLLTSALYVAVVLATGMIPAADGLVAYLRFWVGDFVGITVTMPFFWLLIANPGRLKPVLRQADTAGHVVLALAMVAIAFGVAKDKHVNLFYLLFLPLIWAAARQGVVGAAVAAFVLQAGIIVGAHGFNIGTITIFELQILGAALAIAGLFLGVVIDEKERISAELDQTLRLAAAGEMAAALTHELNQPLTALSTYGAVCEHLLGTGETGEPLRETIRRMISESARAAEVVRRLRDFFRTGATRFESIAVDELLAAVEATYADKAKRRRIELRVTALTHGIAVFADRLQLEVLLRNLLANAFDALDAPEVRERRVTLSASATRDADRLIIQVEDTGHGISEEQAERIFETFHTTKASGMGLGLAISRAIAEAHGGTLTGEAGDHGLFKLVLPLGPKGH